MTSSPLSVARMTAPRTPTVNWSDVPSETFGRPAVDHAAQRSIRLRVPVRADDRARIVVDHVIDIAQIIRGRNGNGIDTLWPSNVTPTVGTARTYRQRVTVGAVEVTGQRTSNAAPSVTSPKRPAVIGPTSRTLPNRSRGTTITTAKPRER